MASFPGHRIFGAPSTRPGRWSLMLAGGFVLFFFLLILGAVAGQRGDTLSSNLYLALTGIAAGACGVAGGILAAIAIVFRRERSIPVYAALVIGLIVLTFIAGEIGDHTKAAPLVATG